MKKVVVWGKFDGLHKGHLEFLKCASKLGDKFYVILLPDKKVVENTGIFPIKTSEQRKKDLIKSGIVTDVYIDCFDEGLNSILKLKPDIFVFGHDQKTKWENQLKKFLSSKGINPEYVYLGIYNDGIHSSHLKC